MECRRTGPWLSLFLNVIIHVAILLSILTIFFDLVISKTMTEAFEGELSSAISENLPKALDKAKQNNSQICTATKAANDDGIFDKLKLLYSQPSGEVEVNNKYVKTTGLALAIMFASLFALTYTLLRISCGYCRSLPTLLLENVIIFIFVGAIEYMFFTHIAMKYVPVPPSLMVESFINNLKKSVQSK